MTYQGNDTRPGKAKGGSNPSEKPLQSWKEIAAYLERDERTAQRWEHEAGLPVRRHRGSWGSSVYAYPSEIEAWRSARVTRDPHFSNQNSPEQRNWLVASGAILTILAAAVFLYLSPILNPPNPMVEAADAITLRQVWAGPEVETSGRISPGGVHLSFVDRGDLAIYELESGTERLLTQEATWGESAYHSVFSPNGQEVVYEWGKRETELRVFDVENSRSNVLYPSETGWWIEPVDWSRNGKSILVRHYTGDPADTYEIGMVSVEDGTLVALGKITCREKPNLWFSPDGRFVVHDVSSSDNFSERDISVLRVADSESFPLVEYPGDDYVLGWVPAGSAVLIASNRSGKYDVWRVPVVDGRGVGDPVPIKRNTGAIHPLGITAEGTLFYGQANREAWDRDVYTVEVDLEGAQVSGQPELEVHRQIGNNWSPEWSTTGDSLAYISGSQILIRDENTGETVESNPELSRLHQIRWSPDGASFLVWGESLEGESGWFSVDRTSGETCSLPIPDREGAVFDVQWFPDGRRILYGRNGGSRKWSEITKLDLETGHEETLIRQEDRVIGSVELDPDGTNLAFTRWRLDQPGTESEEPKSVSLMTAINGREITELVSVESPELISNLSWSHDGRFLIFGKSSLQSPSGQRGTELWRIDTVRGTVEKLGWVEGLYNARQSVQVHPGNSLLSFTLAAKRAEVWAMQGFLSEDP